MTKIIDSFFGEYRWLSNFWPAVIPVVEQGTLIKYPSVEHAYQAAKCADPDARKQFIGITAGQAKRLGKTVQIRQDWERVKWAWMYNLVLKKFDHFYNRELYDKLQQTGDAQLIEGNSWGDTYWGVCNGIGENHLGKILMTIRDDYRMQTFFERE